MVLTSDPETEDSPPQPSSSRAGKSDGTSHRQTCPRGLITYSARLTADENPLADFAFDKLPTELLVEIFKHAHPDNTEDACTKDLPYPVALAQVCHHWRTVALGAPTLWTNINIVEYYTKRTEEAALAYLERSKSCPLFLTWFSRQGQTNTNAQEIIDGLIIPGVDRWQRITLIADTKTLPEEFLAVITHLDFPILRDFEICYLSAQWSPFKLTLCRNAPLLRRCKLDNVHYLPPFPSNLVVFDCTSPGGEPIDLDPLLDFLPHVAHSLEHLRFGPCSGVSLPHRKFRISLQNLKTLIVKSSHTIMDYILAPNLTYFSALHPPHADARKVAEMFNGFSAPELKSIRFYRTPLQLLLASHNLPSMFPQLESVAFINCVDESDFVPLLEPPQPKKPSSLQKASKYPPKHRKVDNPLPKLKELTISDMRNFTTFQAAIEKRLKNGDRSLRKILLPKREVPDTILRHLTRWLPKQGIELLLYETEASQLLGPPEFLDDLYGEDFRFYSVIKEESDWGEEEDDDYYDEDFEYWEERLPNDYFDYDVFDDGDEEDEEEEDADDFYEQ
jgi:hypothetical protein